MSLLTERKAIKDALSALSVPVRYRGESLPDGPVLVIDAVSDASARDFAGEAYARAQWQVGAWSQDGIQAIQLEADARVLLEAAGFSRTSTTVTVEDGWTGALGTYERLH